MNTEPTNSTNDPRELMRKWRRAGAFFLRHKKTILVGLGVVGGIILFAKFVI